MSLTNCLQKATALSVENRAAVLEAVHMLRASGMEESAASKQAVEELIAKVEVQLQAAEKAQNGQQQRTDSTGASNDTQGNDADNAEPLEQQLSEGSQQSSEGLAAAPGDGVRGIDAAGNGRSGGRRAPRGTGVGRGKKPVLPDSPAQVRPVGRSPVAGEPDAQNQLFGDAPGNYEITADDAIGEGTEGQKLRANMEAIRTLRRIQQDNRNATPEEQAVMAKFIGWGGLRKLIDPNTTGKQWLDARAELLGTNGQVPLLIDGDKGSEWIALQRSTTAAHFTAPEIVTAMWGVVRHFGFSGGRVLEPTSGIGNFIGLQPRDLAASSQWHGAELDILTGQMAQLIYPEASISAGIGFENVPFAKGAFSLAIGNPPFGSLTLSSDVAAYKGIPTMKIHNFIISKTGEHLRPGGVMAMVVTHRFMDTANTEAREHLAKSFKFLGAFRLPNDAFLKNAGTEVTTDVVFLQKLHVGEKATDLSWLDTEGTIQVDGQAIRVNRYYEQNPANILGRSAMDGTMYAGRQGQDRGGEYTVHSDGRDLTKAIADMLTNQWADLKDVAKPTNSDTSAAAVMIQQSDLPIGGVMLDADGRLLRREMDDAGGNAVIAEITPQTLWRDGAEKWKQALDMLTMFKDKNLLTITEGAEEFKAAMAVAYTAKGEKKTKPTKAEQAIYDIAGALDRPGFSWSFDAQLDDIRAAVQRRMLNIDGHARLKGLVGLRNTTLQLIEAERRDSLADMNEIRARLNVEYDAFVDSYGLVSEPDNSSLLDGDTGVESGLEAGYRAKNGKVKASASKADIFTRRVNFPYREVTSAKDAADGLQVSLSERGKLDIPYIAKLTGQTSQQVIAELSGGENPSIFLNPDTNEYTDADDYLSGNVKSKLQKAKDAGLRPNVRALEAVQPAPKVKDNVRPSIRGAWMPESVFADFLTDLGAKDPRVSIIASQGMILASSNGLKETEFGSQFKNSQKSVVELFNSAASGKPITIWVTDSKGNRSKNETATKEVNLLVERMAKVFNEWAWSNETRVQQVVDAFNEKMNTHIPRQYDGNKYLRPVGASPSIELRTTQKNAAWRIVQAQSVLLDHVVGAGKTYTVITGAMQRRRLGLSRKPMIVVPNHLVTQWARDFYSLYPGAKILAATPDDFAKNRRRRLFSRIATGDFDAVIIGHSSLAFIETPLADQQLVINEQIKELQDVLNELKKKKEIGRTLTQIQEKLQKYEGKLKELQDVRRDEIGIDLEKMGVDYLAVDEMHEFKNLEYSTAGERVVGMNDPKGSKKAFDLYLKIRGILARGGSVTGATGTPVSNSLVELYTMMKYLAHQDLVERNQLNFDAWSGAYARTETKLEYTATQKLKSRRVLAGLNNLSALKQLYEQFGDVISMADLKRIHAEDVRRKNAKDGTNLREEFPVPKVKTGGRSLESGSITEAQSLYMDYLVARMQAIEANKRDKNYARLDNPLYVLTDARKMSLDIRIVDPTAPRDANGKVMRAAANVFATYKKWDKDRGAQMIFCDLSTPSKNALKEARSLIRDSVEKLFGGGADGKRLLARVTAMDTFSGQWRLLESMAQEVIENESTDPDTANAMEEYLASLEDVDATMTTADVGFSVYDDMRAVLVEKGIPEAEIAFIHDYNTPEQKAKLFASVNDGTIRVLMGSSAKMGAGTNAQRRLVAMHHMDAPWRPSDVEQREGRIIRQGNMLYERDPDGFDVDIRAYSTAGTSDAVMWQVLERKARAIEEFRSAGLDHTDEEGSDSNQYAEFMAQSTGNPVFRLKLEAERAVDLLDTDSRGALLARSQAQRFLQSYDEDVASAKAAVSYADAADVGIVEVAGQKGTAAELDSVLDAARQKYEAAYADYLTRKTAADEELKAWNELTELERGDKPKMPAAPSMPGLLSKSVLDASGYARAIKAALERAGSGGYEFTFGTMRLRVRQSLLADDQWVLQAWNGYTYESYVWGEGKTADASSKLANAMAPGALRSLIRTFGYEGRRRLNSLVEQYDTKVKIAAKDIDTRKLEQAKEVMEWLRSQVSFAEQQADIRRGERPNRYIAADKKRPLSQARAQAGEKVSVEFEGEVFQLTGFADGVYMQAMGEDGREVLLRMPLDKNGKRNAERLVEQPRGVTFSGLPGGSKARSTNLAQTGAPEANATDVVFSRNGGPAGVHMADAKAIVEAIRAANPAAPTIHVHETLAQAPKALRDAINKAGAQGDVEAAFHEGEIHVFPSHMASVERMAFVVGHHEIRHYGLRSILGPRLGPVALSLWTTNPALRAAAQKVIDDGHATSRVLAIEEALADMPVADLEKLTGWGKVVAAIRQWLRGVAQRLREARFPALADAFEPARWTDNDVAALVSRAEGVSKGGPSAYRAGGTAFGRESAKDGDYGNEYGGEFWRRLGRLRERLANARLPEAIFGRSRRRTGAFAGNQPGRITTGLEPVTFGDRIGGWTEFVSFAKVGTTQGGNGFSMHVVPMDLLKSATEQERRDPQWDARNAVLTINLYGEKAFGFNLSIQTPVPGDPAFDKAAPGTYKATGQMDAGGVVEYQRLNIGNAAIKDYITEAARRFGLNKGFAPDIIFNRETGANPSETPRTYSADTVEARFSRAPTTTAAAPGQLAEALTERERIAGSLRSASQSPKTAQDFVKTRGGVFDFNRMGETGQDRVRSVVDKSRPFWLGALTRDQIADVYGKEIPQIKDYDTLTRAMENQRSSMAQKADDLYQEWSQLPTEVNDRLARIMLDSTVNQVHPDREGPPAKATADQKQAHARVRESYLAMPSAGQAMYAKVRDAHAATLQDLKTALEGRIDRAMANGQEKAAMLADIRKRFDQYLTNGPYFPLTRFGDFLVVATRDDGERVVASYESAGEQQSAARALEADGFAVKLKTAKTYNRSQDGAAGKFIGEVLTTIDKIDMVEATINGSRSDLKNQLLDDINQLFIKSMPDMSYRKHFAHRKNTPGFSADVMRGFASSAFHSASHIARLNHSDRMTFELEQAFKTIEQAPGGDFNQASQVLNEMANRHEAMLNPQAHPLSTLATQVGFTMYLGLSPAAGLINMLQVPMVALPYIGARYGFAKTAAAMSKAYTDIMGAKVNRKSGFNAAQSPKLTAEERQAISTLQDEGVIDLTQAHDLAAATDRDIGNQARSRTSFAIARAMKIVGWTFHVPEVMNRQVTALMAYRLETDKGGSVEQAMDAAREAIKRTQFDYSSSNRARYMQGNVARVVTQFKQFSQNMTYFLGRAAYQALKDEDPDVRRIARRQILSTFAVTGAMAGSMGLPGIGFFGGLLALLAGAMSDDDEPWDWKAEYRNLLADTFGKEVGEVLAKGVPRALMPAWDISGRVGLADLWWRGNDREGQNPRESFASDMSNVLGPTAGSILGWYTAADHMQRGNYAKAVEAIVPKFIRDPIKAGREAAEGITSYSGEPLMDTTAGEDLGRILGFAPARASEMYEARNAVMNAKTVIEEKRQALLSQIAKSIIDGDRAAQAELRAEISGFNARNPAFNIGTPNIIQSVLAKRRNRANTQDGILLPQSKAALRDIGRFANIE